MTPGLDSYVSEEQALVIARALLPSSSRARRAFEAMETEDRSACLLRAMMTLEGLRYTGHRTDPAQPLQFPRNGETDVPPRVMQAQVMEACFTAGAGAEGEQRAALIAQGVKGFSLGSLSESYGTAGAVAGAHSPEAALLLRPYLLGVAAFA